MFWLYVKDKRTLLPNMGPLESVKTYNIDSISFFMPELINCKILSNQPMHILWFCHFVTFIVNIS